MTIEFNLLGPATIEFDLIDSTIDLNVTAGQVIEFDILSGGAGGGGYVSPTPVSIVDGTTTVIPAGKYLQSIAVVPSAGIRFLTVGYSVGTGELIDNEEIASMDSIAFSVGIYFHSSTTIYFSGFTGTVLIYLL